MDVILAVMNTIKVVVKITPWKKFRPVWALLVFITARIDSIVRLFPQT